MTIFCDNKANTFFSFTAHRVVFHYLYIRYYSEICRPSDHTVGRPAVDYVEVTQIWREFTPNLYWITECKGFQNEYENVRNLQCHFDHKDIFVRRDREKLWKCRFLSYFFICDIFYLGRKIHWHTVGYKIVDMLALRRSIYVDTKIQKVLKKIQKPKIDASNGYNEVLFLETPGFGSPQSFYCPRTPVLS